MASDLEPEAEATALALQHEIQVKRAELVDDIDRLRDAVRERVSVRYFLDTHPRLTQALTVTLGVMGVGAFWLLWRATARAAGRRDAD
jgi:hypothetical protein